MISFLLSVNYIVTLFYMKVKSNSIQFRQRGEKNEICATKKSGTLHEIEDYDFLIEVFFDMVFI
jgi:hypothetical protein